MPVGTPSDKRMMNNDASRRQYVGAVSKARAERSHGHAAVQGLRGH